MPSRRTKTRKAKATRKCNSSKKCRKSTKSTRKFYGFGAVAAARAAIPPGAPKAFSSMTKVTGF